MFKRFRTSMGFGVHSPFAFAFIREVLKGTGKYYDFSDIDHILEAHNAFSRHNRRLARLLFRTILYLKCATVEMPDETPAWLNEVLDVALKNLGSAPKNRTLMVVADVRSDMNFTFELSSTFNRSQVLVVDMKKVKSSLIDKINALIEKRKCGMTFRARRNFLVYVADWELPVCEYKLYF